MAASLDLEEQEQLAAIKHFWNRWGHWITGLVIVALAAFAGWNGWQYWQGRQAAYASVLYDTLETAIEAGDTARVQGAFADLKDNYGGTTYAGQGALLAGKALLDKGKTAEGKAALAWAADKASTDGLRAVARLHLSAVLTGEKSYDAALRQLAWGFPPAFAALAADRRGDVLVLQGKSSEAVAEYGKAYQALSAQGADAGGYRRLVGDKLTALGINPGADGGAPSSVSATSAQGAAS